MQLPAQQSITWSLWTFPLSSILAIVALILRQYVVLPSEDLAEWATNVVSANYMIALYLYILAYVLPIDPDKRHHCQSLR